MNILLVLIPLSILLALGAGIAFFWAVDHDQFDDLDTPKLLPLLDHPGPTDERASVNQRRPGERRDPAPSTTAAPPHVEYGNERRAHSSPRPSVLSPHPNDCAPSGKHRLP